MLARKRVILLICIMAIVTLGIEAVTIYLLYHTAFAEERARLVETARSQARLIEAVARFDARYNRTYPEGAYKGTISQIIDAHTHYQGSGRTSEFTLAKREGDHIVYLLSHRAQDYTNPGPIEWNSNLAQPMRLALSGRFGSVIGLDYRGNRVLAAYEPVAFLGLGIVAKIDLNEIRAPFIHVGMVCAGLAILAVCAGAVLFIKITNPLLEKLQQSVFDLHKALARVKRLDGLLPICSSCKRIRDDKGYWNQIESYIRDHSEADFSHGLCPECARKLYPELYSKAED